ncbi:MAG TPA: hypothetical protein VFI06_12545 [Chitinophagaceae bacterium]|nr:hypothetical protein [Chitinophagaceae bacterium]
MGLFLTFSVFNINESKAVEEKLRNYVSSVNGGLEIADIGQGNPNYCSILNQNQNTIVTYPSYFTEYIKTSEVLSQSLKKAIYTFSIYDGDYWMLYIFDNGELSARFNPFPDYWSEKEDREQVKTWNFDLDKLCRDFKLSRKSVDNYFIEWKKGKKTIKAYKDDEFGYGDCFQVFDLLKQFNITYDDVVNSERKATSFKLWTSSLPLQELQKITLEDIQKAKRYTKNYLKLLPEEIETILGIDYKLFVNLSTKNQNCLKCNSNGTEREDLEYYLSINELTIKTTGHCKNCGKRLDGGWGIIKIDKLLEVLER